MCWANDREFQLNEKGDTYIPDLDENATFVLLTNARNKSRTYMSALGEIQPW